MSSKMYQYDINGSSGNQIQGVKNQGTPNAYNGSGGALTGKSGMSMGAPISFNEYEIGDPAFDPHTTPRGSGLNALDAPGMGRMMAHKTPYYAQSNIQRDMRTEQSNGNQQDRGQSSGSGSGNGNGNGIGNGNGNGIGNGNGKQTSSPNILDQFVTILGARNIATGESTVLAIKTRTLPTIAISGIPVKNSLVTGAKFSFSGYDPSNPNNTVNFGESPLLDEEVQPFVQALQQNGLKISALHNHWVDLNTKVWYIHWQGVMSPIQFAKNTSDAWKSLLY